MTKDEARTWVSRWKAVEERERAELRCESYESKFRDLAYLMASSDLFDLSSLDAEDAVVRERWTRLRSLMRNR